MKAIGAFLKDQGGDFSKFKVTLFGMGDFFMITITLLLIALLMIDQTQNFDHDFSTAI